MVGQKGKKQRVLTGYISGWRLWLSILAVVLSLALLSQAQRISELAKPTKVRHAWTITAHGVLTHTQQCDIEEQLNEVMQHLPRAADLSYSLRPVSRTKNIALQGITSD